MAKVAAKFFDGNLRGNLFLFDKWRNNKLCKCLITKVAVYAVKNNISYRTEKFSSPDFFTTPPLFFYIKISGEKFFFSLIHLKIRGNRSNRGNLGVITPFISPKSCRQLILAATYVATVAATQKKNGVTTPFYLKLLEKSRDFFDGNLCIIAGFLFLGRVVNLERVGFKTIHVFRNCANF